LSNSNADFLAAREESGGRHQDDQLPTAVLVGSPNRLTLPTSTDKIV
jgi:hypothetical protein